VHLPDGGDMERVKGRFSIVAALVLAEVVPSAAVASPSAPPPAVAAQADYAALLTKLKAGDTSIDFAALRAAYVRSSGYSGADRFDHKAAFEALAAGKFDVALRIADDRIAESYMDLDAHIVANIAHDRLGHADRAAFEHAVAKGMVDAILKSGDGKSAASPFRVISVSEEYILLNIFHLQLQSQSLVTTDGAFDVMKVVGGNGVPFDIWFDISAFYGKGL